MTNARVSRAARQTAKPEPVPARISDSDMDRHRLMVSKFREAQALAAQAQQLQTRANDLAAAFRIWAEELHERYGLDASRDEGVAEDGAITRAGG